jgi:large subunit ribosomal protein L33
MRVKVKLKSTESPYYYTTTVNKSAKNPAAGGKEKAAKKIGKLEFRKYDPVVRRHVIFKEDKIK